MVWVVPRSLPTLQTRVLVLYEGSFGWCPGTVTRVEGNSWFTVKFDGYPRPESCRLAVKGARRGKDPWRVHTDDDTAETDIENCQYCLQFRQKRKPCTNDECTGAVAEQQRKPRASNKGGGGVSDDGDDYDDDGSDVSDDDDGGDAPVSSVSAARNVGAGMSTASGVNGGASSRYRRSSNGVSVSVTGSGGSNSSSSSSRRGRTNTAGARSSSSSRGRTNTAGARRSDAPDEPTEHYECVPLSDGLRGTGRRFIPAPSSTSTSTASSASSPSASAVVVGSSSNTVSLPTSASTLSVTSQRSSSLTASRGPTPNPNASGTFIRRRSNPNTTPNPGAALSRSSSSSSRTWEAGVLDPMGNTMLGGLRGRKYLTSCGAEGTSGTPPPPLTGSSTSSSSLPTSTSTVSLPVTMPSLPITMTFSPSTSTSTVSPLTSTPILALGLGLDANANVPLAGVALQAPAVVASAIEAGPDSGAAQERSEGGSDHGGGGDGHGGDMIEGLLDSASAVAVPRAQDSAGTTSSSAAVVSTVTVSPPTSTSTVSPQESASATGPLLQSSELAPLDGSSSPTLGGGAGSGGGGAVDSLLGGLLNVPSVSVLPLQLHGGAAKLSFHSTIEHKDGQPPPSVGVGDRGMLHGQHMFGVPSQGDPLYTAVQVAPSGPYTSFAAETQASTSEVDSQPTLPPLSSSQLAMPAETGTANVLEEATTGSDEDGSGTMLKAAEASGAGSASSDRSSPRPPVQVQPVTAGAAGVAAEREGGDLGSSESGRRDHDHIGVRFKKNSRASSGDGVGGV